MTQWTPDQLTAIQARGGDVLVSAAAGSGKTAVLIERVLRRLTDPVRPSDIDRFLLVTFTNAAASEMRGKLADAISARLEHEPDNARLRRQLFLVHKAQITTVHAFCLTLVREHAAELDLPPDFRLTDEHERAMIRDEVLETVLERCYAEAQPGFQALCDLLVSGQNDRPLTDTVLETFEKTRAHADPDGFLQRVRETLSGTDDPAAQPHGRLLLAQAREAACYGLAFLREAQMLLQEDAVLAEAYGPAFASDAAQAQALCEAIDRQDWDAAVQQAQDVHFDRLKSVRGYPDKAFQEMLKGLREEWKTAAATIRDKLLCVTREQAAYDCTLTQPALAALIDCVQQFAEAFAAEKRRRGLADFNDLEHFAVRLLYTEGKPSALAETLAAGFDEILVDEYQDTNGVQDAIFAALARNDLFLVGDVKQSIYGFRLADPYIFLEKYQSFSDAPADGAPRRVVLSRNFRSRSAVLDTANYIFGAIMSRTVGDLDYTAREALYVGADYPLDPTRQCDTELWLLDTADDDGEQDKAVWEARMVARRIRTLIDSGFLVHDRGDPVGRPVRPSDIVILMRSPRARGTVYREALAAYGLSVQAEEHTGLLQTTEVGAVVSLLAIIDNPRQDVELIGALRSPLFAFSEQKLAEIRLVDRKVSFYDALVRAGETDEQAAAFLRQLADWRTLAADLPVYRLLWQIYDQTGALGVFGALPGGTQRQRNLLSFFERARSFEQAGTRGLFRFVQLLRAMRERGEDFDTVHAEDGGGAVRIMSIHKSKGLEFPVVILADLAKRFNERDLTAPVLVHPQLGFGAKCRDLSRGVRYDTLERQAVAVRLRQQAVSEELRVLYVALTRAKEKLILTAASAQLGAQVGKLARLAAMQPIPPYAMGSVRAPLAWILTPLLRHPAAGVLRGLAEEGIAIEMDCSAPENISFHLCTPMQLDEPVCAAQEPAAFADLPALPPDLVYPQAILAEIPAKLTATARKRDYKAVEAAEETRPSRPAPALRRPDFAQRQRGLTPAERGTAQHLFLQFCDFDACAAGDIEREIERLRSLRLLSDAQADAVDAQCIARFFRSDFYRETMRGACVRREFKFSVVVPAERYYLEAQGMGATVLLQGVIDCLVETEEGFIILDFKSDRITADGVQARAVQYRGQMEAYQMAVEQIFARPAIGRKLFFLQTGSFVDLM